MSWAARNTIYLSLIHILYSPVTGVISAVNEDILDSPEMINEAPYEAWLIEVKEVSEREELVDSAAYEKICEEEG